MFRKIRSIVHWKINILEEIKEYLIKQDEVNEEFRQELRKQKENSEDRYTFAFDTYRRSLKDCG